MAFSLLVALAVGFLVTAPLVYRNVIGIDPSGFPAGPRIQAAADALLGPLPNTVAGVALGFGALLAVGALAFVSVWAAVNSRVARTDPQRRRFLTGMASGIGAGLAALVVGTAGALARALFGVGNDGRGWARVSGGITVAVPTTHPEWLERWKGSRIGSYPRLGRTGVEVSDIALGSGRIAGAKGERIVREAVERGLTYIDTAPDYSANGSEEAIGRAIRGVRDRLFLATKFCTAIGHLPADAPVGRYMKVVEASLRRLGTDRVDLVHIHACDSVGRLMADNVHEAFDRLKEAGKARFLGFSSHTPNLVEVANTAIDSGRFDVMMLAYHHGVWAPLGEILARARREQDMGVVAMKTLKGAKHHGLEGFREHADAYTQSAFKWVLSNPDVSCLVVSFFEDQHVDEYLYASGKALARRDVAVLREYDRRIVGSYCAPHCGECLRHCPEGLPIHDVLRHRMYFEDYGWEKEGMRLYAGLEKNASVCASCSAPCLGTCPVGVPIQERMIGAHEMLTLS